MKVITRCVIDFETLEIVEEESFEWNGPLSLCKGGGTSGSVDWPSYMKTRHNDWLDQTGTDTITASVTEVMNTALATSPFAGKSAYDPATYLTASGAAITAFSALLAGIVDVTSWAALFTQSVTSVGTPLGLIVADKTVADIADTTPVVGITNAVIVADVAAFAADQDDNITVNVLPRYRRGMQDIGAVVSSAFPIGEAIIEAFQARDVAKYDTGLRLNAANRNVDVDIRNEELHLEVRKTNVGKDLDLAKMNIAKDIQVGGIVSAENSEFKRLYLMSTESILKLMLQRLTFQESLMRATIDSNRIAIVAKKEQTDADIQIDDKDALWDLEVFQYGGNLLASIGGGTSSSKGPSLAASVIGGALGGAAAGAYVGSVIPGLGTAAGAVIGGVLGAAGGLLS
jgi:hypothetical protein